VYVCLEKLGQFLLSTSIATTLQLQSTDAIMAGDLQVNLLYRDVAVDVIH
jgi:hypothetical protein